VAGFTLSLTATGTPAPAYQWLFNGTNISGATTNSYSQVPATASQSGNYSCVVTNAYGSVTSSVVSVLITNAVYAPAITVQPVGVTNSTVAGFTVSLTATGTPALAYQWLLNGTNLNGATANSYSQSPATTNQSGSYSCVVTNAYGSVTSATDAVLITNVPPALSLAVPLFVQQNYATPQSPQTQVAVAYPKAQTGGNANLLAIGWDDTNASISAVGDSAGNVYQAAVSTYRGNGMSQAIYYSAGIKGGSNTVTVTFNPAAAYVDLRVTEYSGLAQTNTVGGGNSGTGVGASVSSGTATAATTNELFFGAGYTLGAFSAAGAGFTSRVITVPDDDIVEDMVTSAPGSYAATAAASANPWVMQVGAFNAAVLSTNGVTNSAPAITVQPVGVTNSTVAGFTLSLTATGTPAPAYQWLLNNTNLSGATTNSYSQTPASTNQSGNYTCVVSNGYGVVTSAVAKVLITNKPSGTAPSIQTQPRGVTNSTTGGFTLALTANGTAPLAYQWYFGSTAISGATTNSYSQVPATAGQSGNYSCVVTNAYGSVTSSVVSVLITNAHSRSVIFAGPLNLASPQITAWAFNSNNDFAVSFDTVDGQTYELQSTSDLGTGSWSSVVTNIPGTGGIVQIGDTNAARQTPRFYRVKTSN
jgi:hypothetical protein